MNTDQPVKKTNNYINALPYLSVLPITEQCLDFSVLGRVNKALPQTILEQLLSEAQNTSTAIPLAIKKNTAASKLGQLKALQKTFEDFQLQKSSLSLGYPIVLMDDGKLGRPVAAPLFLWKVELDLAEHSKMDWNLKALNNNKGYLNPILKNYLEARFELDWESQIGLIDTVDQQVVEETCQKLSEELQLSYSPNNAIEACPAPNDVPHNIIVNSMILGSFEPITLKEAQKLPKNLKPRERKQWKTKVAALPSNSAQDELIGTIFNGHHVAAEGISNTGKTHIIASILPSLLADKGAALIVSPQPSSFNDIQHHLEKLGIKNIGILNLQDEVLDKERLIDYLEKLPKRTRIRTNFDNVVYSKQLDKYMRLRKQLEKAYEALHQPTIKQWNWTDLVGQCLQYHQKSDKQLLGRFLDNKLFSFTTKEHYVICRELGEHFVHYHKIDALKHGLNALHSRYFSEDSTVAVTREAVRTDITLFRTKINHLYQSFLVFEGDYAEHLKFQYRDYAADLEQQIDKIESDLHLYNDIYGEAFDKQSSFQNAKVKFLAIFSNKYQEIRAAKEQLLEDYQNLQTSYESAEYFTADFPNIAEEYKLADIEGKLEAFRKKLQAWAIGIPSIVEEQIEKLSSETKFPSAFQELFNNLQDWYLQLGEQINHGKVLKKDIELADGQLSVQEDFLLKLLLQFQKLENEFKDIDAYYHWRRSWLNISSKTQKVVQALVSTDCRDWLSGFQSWFYHQILSQNYSIDLPRSSAKEALPFDEYINTLKDVQKRISKKADLITKERQSEQIKRIKREKDLSLTNARKIFTNKKIKDLLQWIGLEHLGEVFPIVLATPSMAKQLLGLTTATFDVIIIDNAHDLSSKAGIELLKLGNQRLVLGQPSEEDQADAPSLLDWMLLQKGRRYQFLENTHSKDAAERDRLNKAEFLEPQSFQLAIVDYLKEFLELDRFSFNKSVHGVVVDIVVEPIHAGQPPLAIICDGGMLHQAKYDFQLAVDKSRILKKENYLLQYVWSVNWWRNSEQALQPLLAYCIDWDKEYKK